MSQRDEHQWAVLMVNGCVFVAPERSQETARKC